MSKFTKCPNRINQCSGADPPFANLSSEATDPVDQIFFDVNPVNDTPVVPTDGTCPDGYYLAGDQCVPYVPPEQPPYFWNTDQTARVPCADGSYSSYTATANLFPGSTQAESDANALNFATAMAQGACSQPGNKNNPKPPQPPKQPFSSTSQTKSVSCPDGTSNSYTVPDGFYTSATSQQAADDLAKAEALRVATKNLICMGNLSARMCVNSLYTGDITAQGDGLKIENAGGPTATWSKVSGTMPNGLSLSPGTSTITGNATSIALHGAPTQTGTFSFGIKVSTTSGNSQTKTFSIKVVGIANASALDMADYNLFYSLALIQSGLTGTIQWELIDPTHFPLPTGLSLNTSTGEISGTPTVFGSSTFTIEVRALKGDGTVDIACQKTFTLDVDCIEEVVLEPTQNPGTVIAAFNYGDVTSPWTKTVATNVPAGAYVFKYVSGAYIQYKQSGPTKSVFTGSGYDKWNEDYLTFPGGTADIEYRRPPAYNLAFSVDEVESRDANRFTAITLTSPGDVTLTYRMDPIGPTENVDLKNSIWSLEIPFSGMFNTDILIGDLPAGTYKCLYMEGAANYESPSDWNTSGQGDEILDSSLNHLADVPTLPASADPDTAESDAAGRIVSDFVHPGGEMYWRLKNTARSSVIEGKPPFPTWKICLAVAPP